MIRFLPIVLIVLAPMIFGGCASNSSSLSMSFLSSSDKPDNSSPPNLVFTPTKGKKAIEIAGKIDSADCKRVSEAFYDAGDAVVEILNYSKANKQNLSSEQHQSLRNEAKKYMTIVTATRKEEQKRCS